MDARFISFLLFYFDWGVLDGTFVSIAFSILFPEPGFGHGARVKIFMINGEESSTAQHNTQ